MPKQPEKTIVQEFKELAGVQDEKLRTQKDDFEKFEGAKLRMRKEADDILKIAKTAENPDQLILDGIKKYAKQEKISLLAAKAQVLQYLSPEWKEKVDAEVRAYFLKHDVISMSALPKGSKKRKEHLANLQILRDEGYLGYIVLAIHFPWEQEARESNFKEYEKFLPDMQKKLEAESKKSFPEKKAFVLSSRNTLPHARKYLQELKPKEAYKYAIELAFRHLIIGQEIEEVFYSKKPKHDQLDCDEQTLLLQKLALAGNLEIGDYINTIGHVSMKLDGFPLVLDTADMRIRHIEEFAKQEEYREGLFGSYFWRDQKNHYLAEYSQTGSFPRKIIGYKKVTDKPYLVSKNKDLSGLLGDLALDKSLSIAEKLNLYDFILEFDPNDTKAHNSLAILFERQGNPKEAKRHYEKSLELNPNDASAYNNLALLLYEQGNLKEAKKHYEIALKLNPNFVEAHYNIALLLYKQGDLKGAQKHYEKALKLNPNLIEARKYLVIKLLKQGKITEAWKYLKRYWSLR